MEMGGTVMKPRKFRLHFNRINMQRGLPTVWTIHLSDRCIPAREVDVQVPLRAVFKPEARQPRAWLEGRGVVRVVEEGVYRIEH